MAQYDELKNSITNLTAIVNEIATPMIYNYIDSNMPSWAHEAVRAAVNAGVITGTGGGLGLTHGDLKTITWMYRVGLFN